MLSRPWIQALSKKWLDITTPVLLYDSKSDMGGTEYGREKECEALGPKGLEAHCFPWAQVPHQGQWQRESTYTWMERPKGQEVPSFSVPRKHTAS